jgi:gamma-glutamyl hydrolase
MYSTMNSSLLEYLENESGPYYSHNWGVLPETYIQSTPLNSFFKITAISRDAAGLAYVASAEAYCFPVYTYQFHSEKHAFEW